MSTAAAISSVPATPGRVQFVLSGISTNVPLPDMPSVYRDAALVSSLRDSSVSRTKDLVLLKDARTGDIIADPVPECLEFNVHLPNLFKWSFFIHTDDVPEDLLESCIWSLQMFIRVLHECTEAQLRAIGHITRTTPGHKVQLAKESLRLNAKLKVAVHLLKPTINKPVDAAVYLVEVIDFVRRTSGGRDPYILQKDLFLTFAEALVRSGTNDREAQAILERLIDNNDSNSDALASWIKAKIFLSRVLRRRGKDKSAEEHEEWLAKWFRKNPHLFTDSALRTLLIPAGETTSPILEALGGPSWLDNRQHTDKTDHRMVKECRHCGAREPMVKLSVCAKCKKIYYCSRTCQKAKWPYHKNGCRDYADLNDRLAMLSLANTQAAQKEKDFHAWLDLTDHWPYLSALGLYRDSTRGKTHIIFEEVVYTPNASTEAREKFRIIRCGVFRLVDVLSEIERKMRLNPGEGAIYCKDVLDEMQSTAQQAQRISFLVLTYGEGLNPWLGGDAILAHGLHLKRYNAEWRKAINPDLPPALIKLADNNISDAEHDLP